jgi:hypothetical protein
MTSASPSGVNSPEYKEQPMKKPKRPQTIKLNAETIKALSTGDLVRAAGGGGAPVSAHIVCKG